ncbi:MAG TPA: ATP-binding protein, partial [Stellaceae bacterium]|nr:ATP-binding protein [Stellaceae bacterium]
MGAVMRAMDWSRTPLGPVEGWSQMLRMMVSFLLANRFPLLLWWGPEFCQLYNDAYRPVLGTKHPTSMGQPGAECWPEIWDIIGPLAETPFSGGPATWMEDIPLEVNRHGFVEETHFTAAYSPVPDPAAPRGIGGVLATVHEITEKVVAERRVVVLRDLGARAMEAKTAADACAVAASALSAHAKDIPFALIYLIEADGKHARLAGSAGVAPGEAVSPAVIDLAPTTLGDPGWHLAEVMRTDAMLTVEDLAERFESVPPGPWSDAPRAAVVVPIRSNKLHQLAGFLVAGLSPRLRFDDLYRGFLELVAGQIATTIANARAYEEERRRAEALAEIDRAKTAFFTNVSHEFRTPLTLMLGPLEDALAAPAAELPERHADLALVHRNGQRLLRLVNTLLDFSRIEAGRVQASFEPVDLAALTADLASVFRAATDKAGLSLTIDCPPLSEPVWVDREMWEKIVLNLLSNAFKFTLAGGIAVRLGDDSGRAVLSIEDTGTGIPVHELPRLFDRFHRVQGASGRTHEGTGIGLALVHELARQHGGSVQVESTVGKGSCFTVSIPLGHAHLPSDRLRAGRTLASTAIGAQPFVAEAMRWLSGAATSDEGMVEQLPAGPLSAETEMARRPTVLLADDNADMRDYVRRLLAARYEVRTAEDGAAALAAAREQRPDLLLSDVMMPRLDGFGLLREIRADPALADLPVILLSARAGEEASIEGLEAGADDYLIKPFTARELLARVASSLEMAAVRREFEQRTAADLAAMTRLQQIGRICVDASVASRHCVLEILDAAIALTGADKGNIQVINPGSGALDIAVQRGFDESFLSYFAETDPSRATACAGAMRSLERVVVEDVMESELFAGQPSRAVLLAAGVRAVHSVPLLSGTGAMLGVISVHYARPYRPSERDMRLLDLLARQAGDYIERREAERALRELNNSLEQKVEARTRALETEMVERQRAEAALHQVRRLEAVGQLTGGIA